MFPIIDRSGTRKRSERRTVGSPVFNDLDERIGTANSGGAVFDADGVQMGVEWPGGEIVDFRGADRPPLVRPRSTPAG